MADSDYGIGPAMVCDIPIVRTENERTRLQNLNWERVRRRSHGECAYCDNWGDDPMMPRHAASERCESGKRPHCTCDTCF